MEKNNKGVMGNKVIKAAMFGSLVGGVMGLLLAPKSGQELRQDLAEQVHVMGDKVVEIKILAQSACQNIEDKTEVTVSTGKNWIQKGKLLVSNMKTLVYEIRNGALTKTVSINASEDDASEDNASEDNASEDNASEDDASEDDASEDNASEDDASEDNVSEDNVSEDDASEDKNGDQTEEIRIIENEHEY